MLVLLPASRAFADAANSPEAAESGFTTRLNQERTSRGLQALATAGDLATLARQHSRDMAAAGHPYHDPNIRNEVQDWQVLGDNVGSGPSVDAVHQGFMGSQVHRDEILDPEYTQVGVGVAWAGNVLYVTEIFRLPRSAQPQAAPAPAPASPAPSPVVVRRAVRLQPVSRSAPATAPASPMATTPPPPPPTPPTTVAAPEAPRTTEALARLPAFDPRPISRSVPAAPSSRLAALVAAILVILAAGAQLSVARRQRRYASMKPSMSPSSTALTLPTS
jgi:hypothetical protein